MSQRETEQQLLQQIVALSQKISDVCAGQPMLIVKGALGHMLVQIMLRLSGNDLDEIDGKVDALAKAIKADARLLAQQLHQEMH